MSDEKRVTHHACPRNCPSSCSIRAETVNGRLADIMGNTAHGYTGGKLCPKGLSYIDYAYHKNRIQHPMLQQERGSGRWKRSTWPEALDVIGGKILELHDRYGHNLALALHQYSGNFGLLHRSPALFFDSLGPATIAQGSPCWSAGWDAAILDFGNSLTSDPKQFAMADTILIWGANPAWTSIHAMPILAQAQTRGAQVVVIDPIRSATAKKADWYIQIRPGTDGALALAVCRLLMDRGLLDIPFLEQYTIGWSRLSSYLSQLNMADLLQECGQSLETAEHLADLCTQAKNVMFWLGFGLQRNLFGGQNMRAIHALAVMGGHIGKPGNGVMYAHMETWRFAGPLGDGRPKADHRYLTINNFENALQGLNPPVKFLWQTCRNSFAQSAANDTLFQLQREIELIVTVDSFWTPTALASDVVLPAAAFWEEWDVVSSYWHRYIAVNEPAVKPFGESKSDLHIMTELATWLNARRPGFISFPQQTADEAWIDEAFSPDLLKQLQVNHWRDLIATPRPLDLPEVAWQDLLFATPSGKVELYSETAQKWGYPPMASFTPQQPLPPGSFRLLTRHHQFTLNSQMGPLRELAGSPEERDLVAYIHPDDAQARGLREGAFAVFYNAQASLSARVAVSRDLQTSVVLLTGDFYYINPLVESVPTDMGRIFTGQPGMAYHSSYVYCRRNGE